MKSIDILEHFLYHIPLFRLCYLTFFSINLNEFRTQCYHGKEVARNDSMFFSVILSFLFIRGFATWLKMKIK